MKLIDTHAATSSETLWEAIPFLDMLRHALEHQSEGLELHEVDGVTVLPCPRGRAYLNERSPGIGNSLILERCESAGLAARQWCGGGGAMSHVITTQAGERLAMLPDRRAAEALARALADYGNVAVLVHGREISLGPGAWWRCQGGRQVQPGQ